VLQPRIERLQGVENAEPCPHCPRRVIFVGLRIPEVDQQAITEILGNVTLEGLDGRGTGLLVGLQGRGDWPVAWSPPGRRTSR
jgi:hypothetical protein